LLLLLLLLLGAFLPPIYRERVNEERGVKISFWLRERNFCRKRKKEEKRKKDLEGELLHSHTTSFFIIIVTTNRRRRRREGTHKKHEVEDDDATIFYQEREHNSLFIRCRIPKNAKASPVHGTARNLVVRRSRKSHNVERIGSVRVR
jgi:hypothetical protein